MLMLRAVGEDCCSADDTTPAASLQGSGLCELEAIWPELLEGFGIKRRVCIEIRSADCEIERRFLLLLTFGRPLLFSLPKTHS